MPDTRSAPLFRPTPAARIVRAGRPLIVFVALQIGLRLAGLVVPPFAFAFVAIAWSGWSAGPTARAITATVCALWVYAVSPTFSEMSMLPPGWAFFAALEALGLLGVGSFYLRPTAVRPAGTGTARSDLEHPYRTLVETSAAVVWRARADGRLLDLRGWENLSGRSARELFDGEWKQQMHPADVTAMLEAWHHATRAGRPDEVECRARLRDGRYRHVRIIGVPLKDQAGQVQEWIGTATDVEDQKAAEEALRGKEAELATIVNAVPGLVAYIDRDLRYALNNETYRVWFGLDPTNLRGQRVESVVGPAAFARLRPEIERALKGEAAHFEAFLKYQHGGSRWVEGHYIPHRLANGEVRGCIGVLSDIAGHKQREKERNEALARYRFLADAMPQIVWTALPDGRIDYVNWRWTHLIGRPAAELPVAETWLEVVHPEERETSRAAWRQAIEHGEPYEVQHRFRRADGVYLWHLSRALPRRNEQGAVVQWVGSSTDIDQQGRDYAELASAREKLSRYAAELEARVRERTASLEDANAELRLLASSVSHDLRTPLHIVQNFIGEIAHDSRNRLSPESADLLDRVGYTTRRMATLMQGLLSYTGMSYASQNITEIALSSVVDEVLDQYRDDIMRLRAIVEVDTPLPPILADYTGTFQVLSNLISNALKFASPLRPLHLHIRAESRPSQLRLWIEDNGIGIHPRDQERIFRLFERLDGAKDFSGSGVGLALVRKAMSRMGGAAGVRSEPNRGSRFWVDFKPAAK